MIVIIVLKIDFYSLYKNSVRTPNKQLEFIQMLLALVVIGGSIWTYLSLRMKEQNDFLVLKVKTKRLNSDLQNIIKIITKVINPVNAIKKVDFACLIIIKEKNDCDIEQSPFKKKDYTNKLEQNILDQKYTSDDDIFLFNLCRLTGYTGDLKSTNDIIRLKPFPFASIPEKGLAFIPLPFYYEENIQYGNEKVTYSYPVDNKILNFSPGVYSVRFFVFREDGGYHRCVHDVFTII